MHVSRLGLDLDSNFEGVKIIKIELALKKKLINCIEVFFENLNQFYCLRSLLYRQITCSDLNEI